MAEDEVTLPEAEEAPAVYVRGAALPIGFAVVIFLGYLVFFLHSTARLG
jgi:hypothetical protein